MMNLTDISVPSASVGTVSMDPGINWVKDASIAIDAPPDNGSEPSPDATWAPEALRTGVCGVVSPRVITLPEGGFRLYYSQILPRPGFPNGANDYDNASCRILSAISADGETWTPEPGVRLTPQAGGAGDFRVVSSEVVSLPESHKLRMYYECCEGSQSVTNSIRSALSNDGGLTWEVEPGTRLQNTGRNYAAPRIQFQEDGSCRLYCLDRGHGIISAHSKDGGLTFQLEPGLRIAQNGPYDTLAAFAPEILRLQQGGFVMYYAGYHAVNRAHILRATSSDGLIWSKESHPVLSPGPGGWDAAKCSEMTIFRLPNQNSQSVRYRMLYEACDRTAAEERGVWRICGATAVLHQSPHNDLT